MKGGISETRIEKRIVITGDADIDHDQVRNFNFSGCFECVQTVSGIFISGVAGRSSEVYCISFGSLKRFGVPLQ